MTKFMALGSVFGWSLFWVFAGLAILSPASSALIVPATLLAFLGLAMGTTSFFWLRQRSWDDLLRADA